MQKQYDLPLFLKPGTKQLSMFDHHFHATRPSKEIRLMICDANFGSKFYYDDPLVFVQQTQELNANFVLLEFYRSFLVGGKKNKDSSEILLRSIKDANDEFKKLYTPNYNHITKVNPDQRFITYNMNNIQEMIDTGLEYPFDKITAPSYEAVINYHENELGNPKFYHYFILDQKFQQKLNMLEVEVMQSSLKSESKWWIMLGYLQSSGLLLFWLVLCPLGLLLFIMRLSVVFNDRADRRHFNRRYNELVSWVTHFYFTDILKTRFQPTFEINSENFYSFDT